MSSATGAFSRTITGDDASKHNRTPPEANQPPVDPLAHVIEGCRRDDAGAQRELVSRTQDRLYRALVHLVGVRDAEDVAQQVYFQVFRRLDRFSGHSSFATWLYRVTVNVAMQHLRRNRGRRSSMLNWEPEEKRPDCCRQYEMRELLDQALSQVEPELRAIFVLREVEGLSYEAIGAAVGIPMGTVASRLSRARHDLQERLRSLGWNG